MTIICAYTDGKHTWLGTDTACVVSIGNSLHSFDCGSKVAIAHGCPHGQTAAQLTAETVEHAAEVAAWHAIEDLAGMPLRAELAATLPCPRTGPAWTD
jgi:hypothetical protein